MKLPIIRGKPRSMRQKSEDWLNVPENLRREYHEKQLGKPYRSTVAFCNWLESLGIDGERPAKVLDLGAGMGANIHYMRERFPRFRFVGIELNPEFVTRGNAVFRERGVRYCTLESGDFYNLGKKYVGRFDGLVSFQTLSWLPDYRRALTRMIDLKAKWIGLTSLFFDGHVSCQIKVRDYSMPVARRRYRETYCNVYSLKQIEDLFRRKGYSRIVYQPFEIDIDLPRNNVRGMGTYTERLHGGRRIQISGPLLMNWYFVFAQRSEKEE